MQATVDVSNTNADDSDDAVDGQVAKPNKKLQIPIDEGCPLASHRVFIDPSDGVIYDASLNQTNASNNNNVSPPSTLIVRVVERSCGRPLCLHMASLSAVIFSTAIATYVKLMSTDLGCWQKFYRIQLLEGANGDYHTWTRWGRVGEHGQHKMLGGGSLGGAMAEFEKKFKDKAGLAWSDRLSKPKAGKYVFLEKSYEPDSEDEQAQAKPGASRARSKSPPKCTLDPSVRSLMELIFDQQYFAAAMQSYNYDVKKLPLGKLSKSTITRGFQALKDLSAVLDNDDPAARDEIEELSNLYYSLIPHVCTRDTFMLRLQVLTP